MYRFQNLFIVLSCLIASVASGLAMPALYAGLVEGKSIAPYLTDPMVSVGIGIFIAYLMALVVGYLVLLTSKITFTLPRVGFMMLVDPRQPNIAWKPHERITANASA